MTTGVGGDDNFAVPERSWSLFRLVDCKMGRDPDRLLATVALFGFELDFVIFSDVRQNFQPARIRLGIPLPFPHYVLDFGGDEMSIDIEKLGLVRVFRDDEAANGWGATIALTPELRSAMSRLLLPHVRAFQIVSDYGADEDRKMAENG